MAISDSFSNKVKVAKFGLGHSLHFDFEKLLVDNNIEFETQINVEYFEADNLEVISFSVAQRDIDKAKELEKKVLSEIRKVPAYPKFMKIFWIGLIGVTLLWILIVLLASYRII